jgi:hypothetical protein
LNAGQIYLRTAEAEAVFNLLDAWLRTESRADDYAELAAVRAKLNDRWRFQPTGQLGTGDVDEILERARATYAAADRAEYPHQCERCQAPLRLRQDRTSAPGRLIDPVGRSRCLPPSRLSHKTAQA